MGRVRMLERKFIFLGSRDYLQVRGDLRLGSTADVRF